MSFVPNISDGSASAWPQPFEVITEDATVSLGAGGIAFLESGTALAVTLEDPSTEVDGATLTIIITGAATEAHVVTYATGFNGGGAGADVATFADAAGNALLLLARGGVWYVVGNTNVTIA